MELCPLHISGTQPRLPLPPLHELSTPGGAESSGPLHTLLEECRNMPGLLVESGTLLILSLLVQTSHMVKWGKIYTLRTSAKHHKVV